MFQTRKCNFLYVCEKENKNVRARACVYMCESECDSDKKNAKLRRATKKRRKKKKRNKNANRHIWCTLRHNLMYSDSCNVQYIILCTTRACIENYKRASDQSPVIFYVISLFLISVSLFLDLYES